MELVDLDSLIEEFNRFRVKTCDLAKENLTLAKQADMLKQRLELTLEMELSARSEVEKLQEIVATAQKNMINFCKMEDENVQLKQKLADMKCSITQLEQMHENKILELKQEMEAQELHFTADNARIKEELRTQMVASAEIQKKVTLELRFENEQLQQQLRESKREKEAEMMQLKMEYDSKLMKMQKQFTAAAAAPFQVSSISQEIFRKKLQHVQMESEKEISGLKQTIESLQESLAAANDQLNRANFPKKAKKF